MANKSLSKDEKSNWFADIYDDLTYLEINTIVKDSITAETSPEFEILVVRLLDRYKTRIVKILQDNSIDTKLTFDISQSYEQVDKNLDELFKHMKDQGDLRIDEHDYAILLRINRFLDYLKMSGQKVNHKNQGEAKVLYSMEFGNIKTEHYDFKHINPRVKARFRRVYDMNAEKVVMQTRFGIDGDVTTRIASEFADMDQQMLLKIHEQHTNLSLSYWKELVTTVGSIIGQVFKYFKVG
ncbi:MAG: hypothetical protein JXR03_03045 [Cyclobacteriaceae bacterium]